MASNNTLNHDQKKIDSKTLQSSLYIYRAKVISVYDGDTVTVVIDLGFNITNEFHVRLYGIDTPELRGVEDKTPGINARERLKQLVLGQDVFLSTLKDKKEKYGRYLATIWLPSNDEEGAVNINLMLVDEGLAKEYIP
jgi:micrococcal nuclease